MEDCHRGRWLPTRPCPGLWTRPAGGPGIDKALEGQPSWRGVGFPLSPEKVLANQLQNGSLWGHLGRGQRAPGSVIPRTKSGPGGDSPSCWGRMPPSLPQQLLPRCSARPWCPSEGLRPEPKPEQREVPASPLPVLTAEKLPAECSHLTALPESCPSSASEEPHPWESHIESKASSQHTAGRGSRLSGGSTHTCSKEPTSTHFLTQPS